MFDKSRISIKNLIEVVKRSGDIDNRRTSEHTALEGARIHRMLQKEAGDNYQAEVYLSYQTTLNDQPFVIDGRADGLIINDNQYMIDEIKTSEIPFEQIKANTLNMYWYQAMCYGFIVCVEHDLKQIDIQLTYYQTIDKEVTKTVKSFAFDELKEFVDGLLNEHAKWHKFVLDWNGIRNESLKTIDFPYPKYRQGQKELSIAVYKSIYAKKKLYVEAPTGVGKTISTLFPTLKAMSQGLSSKIFYLTAKTITRSVVVDAIKQFKKQDLKLKAIVIYAKDKICFLDERNCNPEACVYAADYYDKLNHCLYDLINHNDVIDLDIITKYAMQYQVCPFELTLDASVFMDLIICDYNYLFDPNVYLKRFFENKKNDYTFLIDEAHNLVNRSREMYSAIINLDSFNKAKVIVKEDRSVLSRLNKVIIIIKDLAKAQEQVMQAYQHPFDDLTYALFNLSEYLSLWLINHQDNQDLDVVLDLYFLILKYLKISDLYDESYVNYLEMKRDIIIKQYCIDPHDNLANMLEKGRSSILFSATFTPLEYYKNILGGSVDDLEYLTSSPFDVNNQKMIIHKNILTTYDQREGSASELVKTLKEYLQSKKGNYMFFFPSYKYLNDIYDLFIEEDIEDYQILKQDFEMSEQDREKFLENFYHDNKDVVAFCVMGGIFSEGIDLKGKALIGVAVISVGLPMINFEQDLIKDYYDAKNNNGFLYAYMIPGMNKVIQSAGRVIRDLDDKGSVLLLDRRFSQKSYASLMPKHWHQRLIATNSLQISNELCDFWQED